MLGVEYPIVAFSHCRDVVTAVTNAGGFGVLGAVAHSPARLEVDLAWIDEHTHGRPYGIDLLLPRRTAAPDGSGIDRATLERLLPPEHQAFVDDILQRYQVPDAADLGRGPLGTLRIDEASYTQLLDVAFAHPIRLVASALGPPTPELIERAGAHGVLVAALAGTVGHAQRHRDAGVDLIVAQGTEAGGHTGEIGTMVLVPDVVDAVAPTPVLAAGGIGSGRQFAAALALGAEGVWCGSVWLTTEEAETQPAVKQKMLAAGSGDTIRSRSLTGKPARMLRSAWTEEWASPRAPEPLPMPLQGLLVAEAQQRINKAAGRPEESGALSLSNYFVGQIVGRLDAVRPARQVVLDMVTEYADIAQRFADQIESATQ